MIRIEATQKVLIGFPCPAGMFDGNKTWNQTQHLRRTTLWLKKNFYVRDEQLRGCGNWPFPDDGDLRYVDFWIFRIVRNGDFSYEQGRRYDQQAGPI